MPQREAEEGVENQETLSGMDTDGESLITGVNGSRDQKPVVKFRSSQDFPPF